MRARNVDACGTIRIYWILAVHRISLLFICRFSPCFSVIATHRRMMHAVGIGDLASFTLAVAGAGFVAGIVGGMFGGGGGLIVVPALYQVFSSLGVDQEVRMHLVIGSSLAAVIPMSLLSARTHWREGNVEPATLKMLMPSALLGSLIAGYIGHRLNTHLLAWIFAAVSIAISVRIAAYTSPVAYDVNSEKVRSSKPMLLGAAGFSIGCLSALIGIGGATLAIPTLSLMGARLRTAVGTSAVLGMVISLPGAVSFSLSGASAENLPVGSFGYVNVIAAAILFSTGAIGASIGAKLTKKLEDQLLKRLFAALLCASALRMVASLQ